MNTGFKNICIWVLVGSLIFILFPYYFVIRRGLGFVLNLPYPPDILYAFKLSMWTSLLSSILAIASTLLLAMAIIDAPPKIKSIVDYLFSLPMGVPHLVSGIALLAFLGQKGFGKYLSLVGLDFVYTTSGIVIAQLFVNLPYAVKTYMSTLELVDERLLFCAKSMGMSDFQVFLHVILPMLKRQIFCIWMILWARALGEFGAVMMLVGVTRMKTETLATSIFLNMSTGDFDVAYGVAVILILVSMITMLVFQKLMKAGEKDA